jgi:precorrin-6A/cobalt-precorrin-6A reductase
VLRLLVLGGTAEARRLAARLVGEPGLHVVSSLAGRVREPALPVGEVRIGGFGGAGPLARWLKHTGVGAIVDATHPFAARMSAHAATAAAAGGVPLLVLRRPGWTAGPGDDWHWVNSLPAAAELVPTLGDRVFVTTGRQGLAAFAGLDLWCLVRSVQAPDPPVPRRMQLLIARGPFTVEGERGLLRRYRIEVLVTKDSGGEMTAAKLTAARQAGIAVVLARRPALPPGSTAVATVDDAARWVRDQRG